MEKVLASIMEQLNQISVHGDDVERMYAVKHMVRQLQTAFNKAKSDPAEGKERSNHA